MDGYELDLCSSLLVAKPDCYGKCSNSSKKAKAGSDQPPSSDYVIDTCAHRGFDPVAARPHLREIIDVIKERNARLPCPLLTENQVSGYGGFVPLQQYQIGKTYTESCIRAIGQLESGGEDSLKLAPSGEYQSQKTSSSPSSNQSEVANKNGLLKELLAQRYDEEKRRQGFVSPYHMTNDDPLKNYIPGYAGFVPKTMNKFGSYSGMTHTALNEFTDALQKRRNGSQAHDPCAQR